MCARFALAITPKELQLEFDLEEVPEFPARYNIAPTQVAPVIIHRGDKPFVTFRSWGLVPAWAKDRKIGHRMINAKCETASQLPAFKGAFERRRCIVPATGFFEWLPPADELELELRSDGKKIAKQPVYFHSSESPIIGFAGLYERHYGKSDQPFDSFTILTTEPNELISPIHDRMPAILTREDYSHWLNPKATIGEAQALLVPLSGSKMDFYEVPKDMNDPNFENPEAIARQ